MQRVAFHNKRVAAATLFLISSKACGFAFVIEEGKPLCGGVLVNWSKAVRYAIISVNVLLKEISVTSCNDVCNELHILFGVEFFDDCSAELVRYTRFFDN